MLHQGRRAAKHPGSLTLGSSRLGSKYVQRLSVSLDSGTCLGGGEDSWGSPNVRWICNY